MKNSLSRLSLLVLLSAVALLGCDGSGTPGDTQGSTTPDGATGSTPATGGDDSQAGADVGVRFVDRTAEAGIDVGATYRDRSLRHILDSTGSGAAAADYDNDGDIDLFVPAGRDTDTWSDGSPRRSASLYRNEGDGTFVDVAAAAGVALTGWINGAYFVDHDGDGDKDLFVTAWGQDGLYRNNGDGTFTDVSARSGLAGGDKDWSSSAAFGDLDGDGDLDLYVTRYCDYSPSDPALGSLQWTWKNLVVFPGPRGLRGQEDVLFRNDGDGRFTDVSVESGIRSAAPLYALAVVFSDLDDDGDLDIYVANDSVINLAWRNDGGLKFTEVGGLAGLATNESAQVQAGMGVDAGDYDGDGDLDLFVTNFSHDWNTLYRNEGSWLFQEATFETPIRDSYLDLSWGAKFLDYDNDGWLDLFVANGHIYPQVEQAPHLNTPFRQANKLYRNLGQGRFVNASRQSGPGMQIAANSRGVVVADFNGDGALDLFVTNLDDPPNLLISEGGQGNWLALRLVGTRSNRDGIGARLTLTAGGTSQLREANPFGTFLSQGGYDVHFGLGAATAADRLEIRWPGGETQLVEKLTAGRVYEIHEDGTVRDVP